MKMKTNNNKGFTLIELIMVIVILGILSAVAVPKFFAITGEAHTKNKAAVIGNIRSGLQLYAANKLVTTGSRAYPAGTDTLFNEVLDEVPDGWTYNPADSILTYSGDGSTYQYDGAGGIQ
jgi:prepilin-type N-terminal cleavage/methylation domain-containing protein